MVSIKNIKKRFLTTDALKGITLSIEPGEFYGLLGPNGAGKSTLLNILCGYLKADTGSASVDRVSLETDPLQARRKIGFVPQEIALYGELGAADNLRVFGKLYGIGGAALTERVNTLLNMMGLYERRRDAVNTFSGGMKRRLNIAASLLHNPPLLLCDEPTVGIDPQSRNAIFDFLESLHKKGTTIIYTTHYMEEAERLCSRIGIIDHGTLVADGTMAELLTLAPQAPSVRITLPVSAASDPLLGQFGTLTAENDCTILTASSADLRLSKLLANLEERRITYSDVRYDRPTLESLFLHLTGARLRE